MNAKKRNIWLLGLVSILLLAASFGAYLVGTYLVPTISAFRAYHLGTTASKQGDFPTAIKLLEKAVLLNSNQSDFHNALAYAYFENGEVTKGWLHVRKSLGVGHPDLHTFENFERFWDHFVEQGDLVFGRPSDQIESGLGPPDKKETADEFDLYYYGHLENPLLVDEVYLRKLVFSKGHLVGIGFHYLPHMPRQFIRHEFDGREWTIGNGSADATQAISEMVTEGQKVTDWTELVTGHVIFKRMPVEALVENFRANIDVQNCEDFRFEVVESSATTATITWSHAGNAGVPAQREIRRVFLGKDGMYNLSYTVKPEGYDPARFAKWLELISEAELVDRGDPQ